MARKTGAHSVGAPPTDTPSEAQLARQNAEARLKEVQGFWPEVRAFADSFRALRTENHFAERIGAAHR
jgi:hypothetical protein